MQRIDAEARVLKLEKEVRDAKTVLKQLKQLPLRSVGDIKRVMYIVYVLGKCMLLADESFDFKTDELHK